MSDCRSVTTIEKAHRRLEECTITVSSLLTVMVHDWPYLAQVVRLDYWYTILNTGETGSAMRYGITNQPPDVTDPAMLLAQVRGE